MATRRSEQAWNEKIIFVLAVFKTLATKLFPLFDIDEPVGFHTTFWALNRWVIRFHLQRCVSRFLRCSRIFTGRNDYFLGLLKILHFGSIFSNSSMPSFITSVLIKVTSMGFY